MDRPVISRSSPVPLHHQLRQLLEQQIRSGGWRENDMIPPESELIERYGVSRTTVRQALADLVAEGLLYRQQGKGTFIAPPRFAQPLDSLLGFTEVLRRQGVPPQIWLLAIERRVAPPDACRWLAVAAGTEVVAIERRVDVGGAPLFWDEHFLSPEVGAEPKTAELQDASLIRWLEGRGFRLGSAPHTMAARLATEQEGRLLQLETGQPVLVISRAVMSDVDLPLVFSRAVYRSDRYELQVTLRRRPV